LHYTYRNVDRNATQQRAEKNKALPEKRETFGINNSVFWTLDILIFIC